MIQSRFRRDPEDRNERPGGASVAVAALSYRVGRLSESGFVLRIFRSPDRKRKEVSGTPSLLPAGIPARMKRTEPPHGGPRTTATDPRRTATDSRTTLRRTRRTRPWYTPVVHAGS